MYNKLLLLLALLIVIFVFILICNRNKMVEMHKYQNSDIYTLAILLFLLNIPILFLYFKVPILIIATLSLVIIIYIAKTILNIQKKYSNALNELDAYKSMYQKERLLSHEYRNNLSIIKSMNSDEAVDQFINEIISYKEQEKNSNIAIGCLKSIVDMKTSEAKELGVTLKVSSEKCFNSKRVRQMNNAVISSMAHITAIALDNAIYAASMSDANVLISASTLDNYLNITIANHYTDNKHKSKNHGFGNKIAESIASKHHIKIITTIRGNTYIKEIVTKM